MNPRTASRTTWVAAALAAALVSQDPATEWTLRGRVVADESGVPIANATVTITGHQATGYPLHWSWLDWVDPAPIVTGADGTFTVSLPPQPGRGHSDGYPSRVHVRVRADARVQQFGSVHLSKFFGGPVQNVGDVRLTPGRAVDVTVVDEHGALLPGAVVRLRHERSPAHPRPRELGPPPWCAPRLHVQATADARGRLVLDGSLAFGRYDVAVVDGVLLSDASLDVTRGAGGAHRLVVQPGAGTAAASPTNERLPLRVRVGVPAGSRVDRVAVHLVPVGVDQRQQHERSVRVVVRCVDGIAHVDAAPPGTHHVRVHAIGVGTWPSEWIACTVDGSGTPVDVALPPLVEQAIVVRTTTGRLVAGATLELVLADAATVRAADTGPFLDHPCHPFTMTGVGPAAGTNQDPVPIAAPVRSDTAGRAALRAIAWRGAAALRVTGPGIVSTVVELGRFPADKGELDVRVQAAGVVIAPLVDPLLRCVRDARAPRENEHMLDFGDVLDPWGKGRLALRRQSATGLALRPVAAAGSPAGAIGDVLPLDAVPELRWGTVAPGRYDVVLVVRTAGPGLGFTSTVVEPPLARIDVGAGTERAATLVLQAEHRAALQ